MTSFQETDPSRDVPPKGPGGLPLPVELSDQILRFDRTGRLVRAESPATPAPFLADAIGKTFAEYLPAPAARSCEDAVEIAIGEGQVAVVSYSTVGQDGVHDFEARFCPAADGLCLASIRDVTRSNSARARLQRMSSIFDASPDLICSFALEGAVDYVNFAFAELLGSRVSELRQMSDVLDQFPQTRERFEETVIPSLLEHGYWRGDLDFVCGNRDNPVSPIVIGHRRPGRLPEYVSIVARDIRRTLRNERELIAARQAAEAASRAKGDFLATMSHEIRTPMNGVIGAAELLLGTELTLEQKDLTTMLHDSGEALLDIVNDVLDFSRIEANAMQLEQIPFDLREALDGACKILAAAANRKGLELLVSMGEDVPSWLVGDPGHLRQILVNLTGNAVKFTERGRVIVRVAPEPGPSAGGVKLRFEVQDTGPGIPPDVQARLFRPFTQADSSMSRRFGGTGLGLVIASRLTGLMSGEMGVLSEAGSGSTFWFTAEFGVAEAPDKPRAENPLDGRRALVLDGDATSQEMILRQLAGWGMRVAAATSERDARRALISAREAGDAVACLLINDSGHAPNGAVTTTFDPASELLDTSVVLLGRPEERPASLPKWAAFVSKPVRASDLHDAILDLIAKAAGHVVPDTGVAGESVVPADERAAGARILLVEDNEINRRIASAMLRSLGYATETADDGFKALDAASRTHYDLILMDCQMPGMDGFEATRKLRAGEDGGRHVPIVALTANAMAEDRDRCLAAGMDDYLTKPLRPGILRDTLSRWLAGVTPASDLESPTPPQAAAPTEGPAASGEILDPQAMDDIRSLDPEGGDALAPLVDLLLENSRSLLGDMGAAVEAGDAAALAAASHTLKGASRNVGARFLGDLCAEMERRSREGSAEETALLDEMRAALDTTALAFAAEAADYQRRVDPERGAESSPRGGKRGEAA